MKNFFFKIKNFRIFRQFPIAGQFLKFCLVGLTNLAVDTIVYWFLTRLFGWYYILAAGGSFGVAVSWSFLLNRTWTFRAFPGRAASQYPKFVLANLAALATHLILFYFLVEVFGIYDLAAKIFAAVAAAGLNFFLNRFWTFRPRAIDR